MNKIFRNALIAALILCGIAACSLVAYAADDAIIYSAEDIASNGRVVTSTPEVGGVLVGGNVTGAYNEGYIRFVSSKVGTAATTSDRLIIEVDDVNLTEYPYISISYKTNINASNLNFNMTTANGSYDHDTKLFFPKTRVVGSKKVETVQYNGKYGTEVVATAVYIPIYSTTTPVMSADDYFDVEYIGFFKTKAAADAYVYTPGELTVEIVLVEQVQRLVVGDSIDLTAVTVLEGMPMPDITYESDNTAVATVSADGKVTGKSAGVATITAKSGSCESTCKVYVLAKEIAPVKLVSKTETAISDLPVINCLGDSITTYVPGVDGGMTYYKWWAQDYQIKYNNYGISGASLTANGQNPFVYRYMNMEADADLIIVKGGTNDFGNTAAGSMTSRADTTYAGALRVLMEGLIDMYPDKQIVFLTPIKRCEGGQTPATKNRYGNTLNDFANTVVAVGEKYNIPVINLYTPEELDFTSAVISPAGKDENGKWHDAVCESDLMPDGLHPSGKGHKVMSEYIKAELLEIGVFTTGDEPDDTDPEVKYGDVNGDGAVDRKDLTRLAQYFARWDVEIDSVASDANSDGTVDRKDLTRLAQYFARWDVELGK